LNFKVTLKTKEDRRKAYNKLRKLIINDLGNGRIPTYHILHIERDGSANNHYMTPISLESVDKQGNKAAWVEDFEFFLKLLLSLKNVVEVEYDYKRPAVIFTYEEV